MAKKRSSSTNSDHGGPEASFKNEVILWGVLALSVILFISNFGIAGKLGSAVSSIFFGLFGFIAYIFPILLFAGTAFIIANQDNKVIMAKTAAFIAFLVFLCMFLELIGGNSLNKSPLDSYLWSVEHRFGGGLVGGVLTWLIRSSLGTVSAYIIDIAAMIICVVLITERSLWKPIRSGSRKVYVSAKNETIRQREEFAERRQRRMDNKVTGVSTDTAIKGQARPKATDAISELHPDTAITQDFPIHVMGQPQQDLDLYAQERPERQRAPKEPDVQVHPPEMEAHGRIHPFPADDAAEPEDTLEDFDNIIPIANQKVVLQPSMPGEERTQTEGEPVQADAEHADWEDDILANSSSLFSDLLPAAEDPYTVPPVQEISVQDKDVLETMQDMEPQSMDTLPHRRDMDLREPDICSDLTDEWVPADTSAVQDVDLYNDPEDDPDRMPLSAEERIAQQLRSAAVSPAGTASAAAGRTAASAGPGSASVDGTAASVGHSKASAGSDSAFADQTVRSVDPDAAFADHTGESADTVSMGRAEVSAGVSSGHHTAVPAAQSAPRQTAPVPNPRQTQAEIASGVADVSVQMQAQAPPRREYVLPPVHLLKQGDRKKTGDSRQHLQETALKLQQTLKNFGVNVTILNVSCGPSVTRYEIQPEMGVKVSKIVNLADDIKLNLAAADIRIEAPIPGKAAIGIEVPNKENVPVMFRDLVESEDFKNQKSPCAFAAGKDIAGEVVVTDICKMPHLLIAGATGSGKSVCINTIIMSIIYKADPDDVKMIMIDPKVVELSVYNGIPHLLLPVVTDPKKAAGALHWAVSEMMDRYQKFSDYGVRDMKGYNAKIKKIEAIADDTKPQKMPYIVIIVDELADLMMAAPGDVEDAICRLAQLARAAGIHLIIATQRPSVNVITGLIKANMPSRIAFSVTSGIDSRTILDMNGAEKLLGKGDMLFYPQGYQKPVRVQGAFVSDSEVSQVVEFLTEHNGATEYNRAIEEKVANAASSAGGVASDGSPGDDRDVYFADAAKLLMEKDKASVSMLQRYFKIGFNRAARIMDQLEEAGVVGPEEGTKPRKILMSPEEFAQYEEEVL